MSFELNPFEGDDRRADYIAPEIEVHLVEPIPYEPGVLPELGDIAELARSLWEHEE